MDSIADDSPKTRELGRMGCLLLRQCRRRTQSEPPKNYKRGDKLKKGVPTKNSHSIEELSTRENIRASDDIIENMDIGLNDDHNTVLHGCSRIPDKGGSPSCGRTKNISNPSYKTFNDENQENFEEFLNDYSDVKKSESVYLRPKSTGDNYSKETFYINPNVERMRNVSSDKLCFPKLMCCRKNRKNNSSSYKNNNNYPYSIEEYLRVPVSNATSSVDSQSTCLSSLGAEGSCPTISSSNRSRNISSNSSSANISNDSGFDEPKCFINLIYENHRCKGFASCHKKEKAGLNIHLRNLMNCMPESFGDENEEPIQHAVKVCSGVVHGPQYLSKRRNAICETSDEMRKKFYEALCAFMTLQAMAKYDFL